MLRELNFVSPSSNKLNPMEAYNLQLSFGNDERKLLTANDMDLFSLVICRKCMFTWLVKK